jgi:tRNA-specific 2-thiouridylase
LRRYLLKKAKDKSKDQTYVLYSLTQEQLSQNNFSSGNQKNLISEKLRRKGLCKCKQARQSRHMFCKNHDYASFIQDTQTNVPSQ